MRSWWRAMLKKAQGDAPGLLPPKVETHPCRSGPLLVWHAEWTPEMKMLWLLARAARRFDESTMSSNEMHQLMHNSKDPGFDGEGANAASAFIYVLDSRRKALKEFNEGGSDNDD